MLSDMGSFSLVKPSEEGQICVGVIHCGKNSATPLGGRERGWAGVESIRSSWSPRIGELDREAILVELWWIGGAQAGELLSGGVDHEQITIRTVVPAKANIG